MHRLLLERILYDVLRVLCDVPQWLLLGQRLELVLDVSVLHLQRSGGVLVHVVPREHVVKLGRVVVHVQRLLIGRSLLRVHVQLRLLALAMCPSCAPLPGQLEQRLRPVPRVGRLRIHGQL